MAVITDKIAFYHIPKTGGTWVLEAMKNAGIEYKRAQVTRQREYIPALWVNNAPPSHLKEYHSRNRFSFCFIRHPIAWYKSYWCYWKKYGQGIGRKHPIGELFVDDFDLWLNIVMDKFPDGYVTKLYSYYVQDVDFVGRTVVLSHDLIRALEMAGQKFNRESLLATTSQNVAGLDNEYNRLTYLNNDTYERILVAERRAFQWCARASMGWLNVEDRCLCDGI